MLLLLLFLFLQLGAEELDDGKLGAVADAPASANDSRVAAGTIRESRSEIAEEFLRGAGGHQEGRRLAPGMKRIALSERDHALCQRTRRLGAKQRGVDAFLLDEVGDEVAQRRAAMRWLAT